MRRLLRIIAALLMSGTAGWWAATGLNPGFTKTSVPVEVVDEVTGIETVDYQPAFVPGLDLLALSATGTALLVGGSFLFRQRPKSARSDP